MQWLKDNWSSTAFWFLALVATFLVNRMFELWFKAPVDRGLVRVSASYRRRGDARKQSKAKRIERLLADEAALHYARHVVIQTHILGIIAIGMAIFASTLRPEEIHAAVGRQVIDATKIALLWVAAYMILQATWLGKSITAAEVQRQTIATSLAKDEQGKPGPNNRTSGG